MPEDSSTDLLIWSTFFISLYAVVQPWLIWLWKRFVIRAEFNIYEAAQIEIGFNDLGPAIGLQGTVHVLHQETLIKEMALEVVRRKDGARHKFSWLVFRDPTVQVGIGVAPIRLQQCRAFLALADSAWPFSILFTDQETQTEFRPNLVGLRNAWLEYARERGVSTDSEAAPHYKEFSSQPLYVDTYRHLRERAFYWQPGEYSLELTLHTSRPTKESKQSWSFDLSEQQSNLLRLEILRTVQSACGQASSEYQFQLVEYKAE